MGNQTRKLRMIAAGKSVLEGLSFKQALMKSGFSESTARTPKQHGLDAEECAKLALAEDSEVPASNLRRDARKLLQETIANADPKKIGVLAAAKTAEVTEKLGRFDPDPRELPRERSLAERLEWMARVVLELARRRQVHYTVIAVEVGGNQATAQAIMDAAERMIGSEAAEGAQETLSNRLRSPDPTRAVDRAGSPEG